MNPTIKLLRTIGSPFAPVMEEPQDDEQAQELYTHAVHNKMQLLYLEALKDQGKLGQLKPKYDYLHAKYLEFLSAITQACKALDLKGIKHVVLKTLRPYPAIPNDIDILVFGSDNEYKMALELLFKLNTKEERAPKGMHLRGPEKGNLWVDLRKEQAGSHFIYMDKKKLSKYLTTTRLLDEEHITTLMPEAELAVVIAHGVITEQVYTLAEYYTLLYHLAEMDTKGIDSFINTMKENYITLAAKTHIALAATLHEAAHGETPEKLKGVLEKLGTEKCETTRLIRGKLKIPHRYHVFTIARAVLEKMKDRKARESMAAQMLNMLNPRLAKEVIEKLVDIRTRSSPPSDFR